MTERGKQPGNIGELMTMGMCVLALTVVMLNYLQNVQLLQAKENVGQLARAYLLKMETVGYLEPAEQAHLTAELETAGLTEIDYEYFGTCRIWGTHYPADSWKAGRTL